jgi:hypothetical protein
LVDGIKPGAGVWLWDQILDSVGEIVANAEYRYGISSVWLITSDEGDGDLEVADFPVVFCGVQPRLDNGVYDFAEEATLIELELKPMEKVIFEAFSGEAIARVFHALEQGGFWAAPTIRNFAYDYFILAGGGGYAWAQGHPGQFAWFFPVMDLVMLIILMADKVLRKILRTENPGTWIEAHTDWSMYPESLGTAWRLFEQTFQPIQSTGMPPPDVLTLRDLYFIGLISESSTVTGDPSYDSSEWIGGLIVKRGQSLAEEPTAWDMLRALMQFAGVKVGTYMTKFWHTGLGKHVLRVNVEPILYMDNAHPNSPDVIDAVESLTPTDLDKSGWQWSVGENDIRACEVMYRGAQSGSLEKAEASMAWNKNEQPLSLQPLFHNAPSLREGNVDHYNNPKDWTTNGILFAWPEFDVRKVYYLKQPSWSNQVEAIRPHDYCQLMYRTSGAGGTFGYDSLPLLDLPAPNFVGPYDSKTQTYYQTKFLNKIADHILYVQANNSMHAVLAKTIVNLFSKATEADPLEIDVLQIIRNYNGTRLLKAKVPIKFIHPRYRGRKFVLNFTEANTKTRLWGMGFHESRKCFLLSAKPDWKAGQGDAVFLATDDNVIS